MNYTEAVDSCQIAADDSACPLATESQPCNWRKDPSLLGEEVYVLPLGSHDDDALPTPCSIGLLGGNGSDAREQASAKCAGLCPAGFFCAEEATVQPSLCPKGRYCPQGTATPLPCEAGSYSDATHLSAKGQCLTCPPGSSCASGSMEPSPCLPGSIAGSGDLVFGFKHHSRPSGPGQFTSAVGGIIVTHHQLPVPVHRLKDFGRFLNRC